MFKVLNEPSGIEDAGASQVMLGLVVVFRFVSQSFGLHYAQMSELENIAHRQTNRQR